LPSQSAGSTHQKNPVTFVRQNYTLEKVLDFLLYKDDAPLIFTSVEFWVFFGIFLLFFSATYRIRKIKNFVILVFSLFFYYKSSGWAVLLLLFSINQDYWIARFIGHTENPIRKKVWISISVTTNLLVLSYFKYAFLFVDWINSALGTQLTKQNWIVAILPGHDLLKLDPDHILLPVGISFFIFHSLSYTIDVYRGIVKPLTNWIDYAVFVSFFPELVAGPIVRARDFVDQLVSPFVPDRKMFGKGILLILGGLFKKIVISDTISTGIVDRVFDQPELASSVETWIAVYGYGIQIFCDFSGYTDIAIGIALILGYHLKPNFDQPYKSINITEFWRRWHISLSVWLRDYLYIPLGGNRKGNVRTYINLLITMLLGGLWHGASAKFILWGGLHGAALALHKFGVGLAPRISEKIPSLLGWSATFHFVLFCWIPFRADTFDQAMTVFQHLWIPAPFELILSVFSQLALVVSLLLMGILLHVLPDSWKRFVNLQFEKSPVWLLALVTLASIILIFQFKSAESQPFIYFQF
jgi:alginate O-acetyltransferase complex protein AlgI